MKVTLEEIHRQSKAALLAHGAGEWQADEVAKAVTRAEQTGNIICGLYYLESYCKQLVSGRVNGAVEPQVSTPRANCVVVDACYGFAQPAFARGFAQAVAIAKNSGVATLAVGHAHTCTSLGYFTEQIAAEGLIGLGFTNASAIVAPPGGKTPVLGTNPMAMSLPGSGFPAMHADFSTAAVALGKITMAKAAGEDIPLGWAVDKDGLPTTDPNRALDGALLSAAGHKGWALGLLVEALAAGMTGSVNSVDVKGLKLAEGPPHDLGQYYILIDPVGDDFTARFQRVAAAVDAEEGARIPGRPRRLNDTPEIDDALWKATVRLAA